MSEPLSSVEIEDVLSSIRRLVSEDLRPVPRPVPPPSGSDKLLLTPALRVVSEPEPEPVVEAEADGTAGQPAAPPVAATIEEVVASVAAAVEAQPQEWEAETGDDAPAAQWDDGAWDAAPEDVVPEEVVPEDVVPEDVLPDGAMAAAAAREDAGDAFGAAEEAGPEALWDADAMGQTFVFHPRPAADAPAEDPDWVDEAEAEVIAALEGPVHRAASPQDLPPEADDADDMVYDEEILRDLVRDLIREELQGTLGERITRNIRKLVRAEIARTLAAQEID